MESDNVTWKRGQETSNGRRKRPDYIEVDGYRLPPTFLKETFLSATKNKPGSGDVLVATYPKCGTTWALQIVVLILRKGVPPADSQEYFASTPFLEMTSEEEMKKMSRPGCIKTHLPFDRINFSKEAKYVYVARHPADCAVSFYHHTRFFPIYSFSDGTFDDFFEVFVTGQIDFNDYFDHLLSWYERRDEPNILFLTYEDMKQDPRAAVLRIARFLGDEHYDTLLENDEAVLNEVLRFSSLEYMRATVDVYWKNSFSVPTPKQVQEANAVMRNYAKILEKAKQNGHSSVGSFIRKGEAGEGKITLSKEQRDRLNERIREKTSHTDVMDLWKYKN